MLDGLFVEAELFLKAGIRLGAGAYRANAGDGLVKPDFESFDHVSADDGGRPACAECAIDEDVATVSNGSFDESVGARDGIFDVLSFGVVEYHEEAIAKSVVRDARRFRRVRVANGVDEGEVMGQMQLFERRAISGAGRRANVYVWEYFLRHGVMDDDGRAR